MTHLHDKNFQRRLIYLRKKKKKIVLCHGVFDLLHLGHIKHFKSAKTFGDYLIVSITSNKFIKKGPGQPIFNQYQRKEFLSQIRLVDEVIISESLSSEDVIKIVKPDFYIKGPDYKKNKLDKTKKIFYEKMLVEKYGGKVKYTEDITFSSTNIINKSNYIFNESQRAFIESLKKKFSYDTIFQLLQNLKKLKVYIVGELIMDNYCFGNVVGKSGKEPYLVLKKNFEETYVGGSGAIARHISSFVKSVELLSPFGKESNIQKILNKTLNKNVKTDLVKLNSTFNTIIKTRFVDEISNYKLFGSYILPDKMSKYMERKLIGKVKKSKFFDLVLVCDYGHNFITSKIANQLMKHKKFISINTQVNAANIGYHTINKYLNCDLLIINESELRQELKDNLTDIRILSKILIKKNKIQKLIVTRGKEGAFLIDKTFKIIYCPAFVTSPVDKVGAGDAMLSLTSLCLKNNFDPELALFIGSIAAAISIQSLGNKENVDFNKLDRIVEYLMK
jgi:rfaE bifunctional protein kinase chain/domain/rfaE bifunctional protein nucleotidyltransferase chain/domain